MILAAIILNYCNNGKSISKKPRSIANCFCINPIQDSSFWGCLRMMREGGWVGGKETLVPEICHTYRTMMKLETVIPYLKKIKQI